MKRAAVIIALASALTGCSFAGSDGWTRCGNSASTATVDRCVK